MRRVMARIRQWLGVSPDRTREQIDLLEEVADQKARVRSLDAYLLARNARDRSQALNQAQPKRRATDRG